MKGLTSIFSKLPRVLKKPGYIGLDLASEKINLVQIDFSSKQPIILNAASDYHNSSHEQLLANPEKFKQLLKSIFKKHPFKGHEVVTTVPGKLLHLLFINYTCTPNEEESQALVRALKNRIHENLADSVIDYLPITPHNKEQIHRMALVAMAKQQDVENYLDLLDSCGLKVAALEIGPVAINRLVSVISQQQDSEKILVINFGTQRSYLTVLWNQQVLLDRSFDFGMDNILKAIASAFDIPLNTALEVLHKFGVAEKDHRPRFVSDFTDDLADDLADDNDDKSIKQVLIEILEPCLLTLSNEIHNVLVYVASETRGGAVEQIYIMGSLARVADLDQLMDQLITIPVKTINPFYGLPYHPSANPDDIGPVAGIAVATGLALRGKV